MWDGALPHWDRVEAAESFGQREVEEAAVAVGRAIHPSPSGLPQSLSHARTEIHSQGDIFNRFMFRLKQSIFF